jgi:hypothetical protein
MLATCAAYWPSLHLPFIQDDWSIIRFCQTQDLWTALREFLFHPQWGVLYRPLGYGYLYLICRLFGPHPLPFHVAALTIHAINGCLVALVLNRIIRDRFLSYLIALVYATAVAIHQDMLAWAVGFFDLGGALTFFLSFWLFLRGRQILSAVVYATGCFIKEAVVVLPLILVMLPFMEQPVTGWREALKSQWRRYIPIAVAMAIILAMRLLRMSPFDLPPTHPYFMKMFGSHVIKNIFIYPAWMLQAFFPFFHLKQAAYQFVAALMAIVLAFGLIQAMRRPDRGTSITLLMFLLAWMIVGILPVLFLPNHSYRYYAEYSLPPFLALVLLLLRSALARPALSDPVVTAVLVSVSAFAVTASVTQAGTIYREGLNQWTLSDGTNSLISKAATVELVSSGLRRLLPGAPKGAVLVIGGADIWSFDKNSGPQVWYDDDSISVYQLSDLKFQNDRPYVESAAASQLEIYTGSTHGRKFFDRSAVYVFQLTKSELKPVELPQLRGESTSSLMRSP